MRYTPDTETPLLSLQQESVGRRAGGSEAPPAGALTATSGPLLSKLKWRKPQWPNPGDCWCALFPTESLSSRNFSLQPSCPLLCLVHSAVSHGLRRNSVSSQVTPETLETTCLSPICKEQTMLTRASSRSLRSPFSSLTLVFDFWLLWKAKGLLQLLSANTLVFRSRAAGSAEFLSILVYPLVGHWGRAGR